MNNPMPSIALATYEELPELSESDQVFAAELRRRGVAVTAAVWSDPSVAWSAYDAVVIRSTWDYHRRAAQFAAWLDRLDSEGARVFNPTAVVRANRDKRYLLDLAARGIATLPTMLLERGTTLRLADVLRGRGWERAVLKPAVSASGWQTSSVTLADAAAAEREAAAIVDDCGLLVQPFAEEVVREGEWSFVFIDGALQACVLKNPKAGDFRVQANYGGSAAAATAPEGLGEQAGAVLRCAAPEALYARVDGIRRGDTFVLMELELIEPELFFQYEPRGATRLTEALLARLDAS
jgi:glutathione synthase/RimK-type ligase-like ATP-grasp enzyme